MKRLSLARCAVDSSVLGCEVCVVVDECDVDFAARFLHFRVDVRPSIWIGSTLRRQYTARRDAWCHRFRLSHQMCHISLMLATFASYIASCVPPINISPNFSAIVATSNIPPISMRVSPKFLRIFMGFIWDVLSTRISRIWLFHRQCHFLRSPVVGVGIDIGA